jgi:SAM-dependent methyltransferase
MPRTDVFKGFPAAALILLRCPVDGGELEVAESAEFIMRGVVSCKRCGHPALIADGILDLLDLKDLHSLSSHEREKRESEWASPPDPPTDLDLAEIEPHLEALQLRPDHNILELGCGSGRYTSMLAEQGRLIVAVDYSRTGLQTIASGLRSDNLALVLADVTRFAVSPESFHSVLSTLTSNLPTADHRMCLYRVAASALVSDEGRFVSGTHFYGLRARLLHTKKNGYYEEGGIYRFYTTRDDIRREITPYFSDVRVQPILIQPPLARTLRMPVLKVSRASERIVGLREFGNLLMTIARKPKNLSTGSRRLH